MVNPHAVHLIVGESDEFGVPMGTAVLSLNDGPHMEPLLCSLLVDSQHRRKGIATRLIKRREELAREHGHHRVHACTHPDNVGANALYKKLGYTKMHWWSKDV